MKAKHKFEDYWYFEYHEVKSAVEGLKQECKVIDPDAEGEWDRVIDMFFPNFSPSDNSRKTQSALCVCGRKFSEHIATDMKNIDDDFGVIYLCPENDSGIAPSVFKKAD